MELYAKKIISSRKNLRAQKKPRKKRGLKKLKNYSSGTALLGIPAFM